MNKGAMLYLVPAALVLSALPARGQVRTTGSDWRHYPDEQGSVMRGETFEVLDSGDIAVVALDMSIAREDGGRVLIRAETCRFSPDRGIAESDSAVELRQDNTLITGEGFVWSQSGGTVEIRSNVSVVIADAGRWMPAEDDSATSHVTNTVTITSGTLVYEPGEQRSIFDGGVHVSDLTGDMTADRMNVKIGDNHRLKNITSTGNVVIRHDGSVATCGLAFMDIDAEHAILTDGPVVSRVDEELRGERIVMVMGGKRIISEPGRLRLRERHAEGEM